MGILLKRNRDGSGLRPMWYIRYKTDGKSVEKTTPVAVAGTPPASLCLRDTGDIQFERSRAKAQSYFENFQNNRKVKGASIELTKALIREKTGQDVVDVRLDELHDRWLGFSRNRQVSEARIQSAKSAFNRFQDFLKGSKDPRERKCKYLYGVTAETAKRYIDSLKRLFATSTVKDHLSLLSGTFRRLLPSGAQNPFADIRAGTGAADDGKVHRQPLTDDELNRLYEVAKKSKDQYLYPITVCAANTGLRIGDVCQLKWQDIYFDDGGHISTVTGKTHTLVHIPIFPELMKVLESRLAEKDPHDIYVFPEAANCYQHNRSGLIRRGKHLFAEALFGQSVSAEEPVEIVDGAPKPPLSETQVLDAIDRSRFISKKKTLSKEVYSRYVHGQSYTQISHDLGILRSRICTLLKGIEELTGETIRPWAKADLRSKRLALTRRSHAVCKNASSVYGWHTLRANFCVQAIFHKIPEAFICKVVGHSTFKTTQEYLNPTWKVFRENWNRAVRQAPALQGPPVMQSQPLARSDAFQALCQSFTPAQATALKAALELITAATGPRPGNPCAQPMIA